MIHKDLIYDIRYVKFSAHLCHKHVIYLTLNYEGFEHKKHTITFWVERINSVHNIKILLNATK